MCPHSVGMAVAEVLAAAGAGAWWGRGTMRTDDPHTPLPYRPPRCLMWSTFGVICNSPLPYSCWC